MRKQPDSLLVRTVRLQSGERLPLLCSRSSGLPLFDPTLYSLTELRARNRSSATIQQALRGIMVLYLVLDRLGVDLEARLSERRLLEAGEIEEVVRFCGLPLTAFTPDEESRAIVPPKVSSLEKLRMRSGLLKIEEVDPGTAAIRLHYLRGYLKWRVDKQLLRLNGNGDRAGYAEFSSTAEVVHRALENRTPASRSHDLTNLRQGLSQAALSRLQAVIQPDSPDNPWKGAHAQERNALIVRWLIDLGLRRGELLGVTITTSIFKVTRCTSSGEQMILRTLGDISRIPKPMVGCWPSARNCRS